jgi:ubiquinone/menaquinone biosynthesis C-methylase UbiE
LTDKPTPAAVRGTADVFTAGSYDDAVEGWATGATLVYAPLARELVARAPHALAGRRVLDVGAGTGVGSEALIAAGAAPIALDLSHEMLSWQRAARPPSIVASVTAVPVRASSVDDVFASFVLNHLADPVESMRELARTVRPGGAFLATTYSNESRSAVRDRVDQVALEHGWQVPDWYAVMKASVIPLLGSASAMADSARGAGLAQIRVEERAVDVGVHEAEQLVRYRFGQAHFAAFLAGLDADAEAAVRSDAVAAIAPIMEPYTPVVVFLAALVV